MNSHKEDTRDTTQHILLVLFDKTISTQGLVSGCLQHFQVVGVFFLIFASVSHLPHLDSFMSILWDAWLQGMLILIYKNSFGCVSTPVALFFFDGIFLTLLRLSTSLHVINTLKRKMSILQILKRMFE